MSTDTAWRERARCRDEHPELFYPVGLGTAADRQAEAAKAVCRTCPVRALCLEVALANGAEDGVWGGTTVAERAVLKRERLLYAAEPQAACLG